MEKHNETTVFTQFDKATDRLATTAETARFLAVTPGDAATFKASTINWASSGLLLANAGIVKLDGNRQVKVFCGGGSTDFIIDITGFSL